jgi:hypothetical protein
MFSKVANKVVSKFLGDYLEYDSNQLKVSVAKGNVDLHGVQLKPEAFGDLPVTLLHGSIEKLTLKV